MVTTSQVKTIDDIGDYIMGFGGINAITVYSLSKLYKDMEDNKLPYHKILGGTEEEARATFKNLCINKIIEELNTINGQKATWVTQEVEKLMLDLNIRSQDFWPGISQEEATANFNAIKKYEARLKIIGFKELAVEISQDISDSGHSDSGYSTYKKSKNWGEPKALSISHLVEMTKMMEKYNVSYKDAFGSAATEIEEYVENNLSVKHNN